MTEAFYSTIAGALVSLVGVLFTLRWNQKLHESNLKEERKKAKEEKYFKSKQEAFILASESVSNYINYYISLADRVLPSDGSVAKEISEFSAALNRLHFYCDIETIEKLNYLDQVLNEAILDVMRTKLSSVFIIQELSAIDMSISAYEKMNSEIKDEVNSLLQSNPSDPLMGLHRKNLAENFTKIAELYRDKPDLERNKYIEIEKCRDVIKSNLNKIYTALRDVLLLARRELSFPIDEERYKNVMDIGIKAMEKNLNNFYTEIRDQVVKRMQ